METLTRDHGLHKIRFIVSNASILLMKITRPALKPPAFEYKRQCPVSIVNLHQTSSMAESQGLGCAGAVTPGQGSVLHSDDELKEMRE